MKSSKQSTRRTLRNVREFAILPALICRTCTTHVHRNCAYKEDHWSLSLPSWVSVVLCDTLPLSTLTRWSELEVIRTRWFPFGGRKPWLWGWYVAVIWGGMLLLWERKVPVWKGESGLRGGMLGVGVCWLGVGGRYSGVWGRYSGVSRR